jgi:hypothetical protein
VTIAQATPRRAGVGSQLEWCPARAGGRPARRADRTSRPAWTRGPLPFTAQPKVDKGKLERARTAKRCYRADEASFSPKVEPLCLSRPTANVPIALGQRYLSLIRHRCWLRCACSCEPTGPRTGRTAGGYFWVVGGAKAELPSLSSRPESPATWSRSQVIAPGDVIESASCTSPSFCMAVDYRGDALSYDGRSWSAPKKVDARGELGLLSVSCASGSFCVATDGDGRALVYNGASWSAPQQVVPLAPNAEEGAIYSISCPTSRFCMAVSTDGDFVEFNGSVWSQPERAGTAVPFRVDCLSAAFCAVTGSNGDVVTFKGSSWSSPHLLQEPAQNGSISSISCPISSFCVVTSYFGDIFTYNGIVWSGPDKVDVGTNQLLDVSCVSRTFCVAVDQDGNALSYNGRTWSAPRPISPVSAIGIDDSRQGALFSVSCVSTTFCAAVSNNGRSVL